MKTESHCCFALCDSTGLFRVRSAYNRQSAEMPLQNKKYIWPFDGSVKLCIAVSLLGSGFAFRTIPIFCTSPFRALDSQLKPPFIVYKCQGEKNPKAKNLQRLGTVWINLSGRMCWKYCYLMFEDILMFWMTLSPCYNILDHSIQQKTNP